VIVEQSHVVATTKFPNFSVGWVKRIPEYIPHKQIAQAVLSWCLSQNRLASSGLVL
jgi:hypothetical protein